MGYDRGDRIPFDFEPNGIPFDSKSKENCHHDHIPFKYSFLCITVNLQTAEQVTNWTFFITSYLPNNFTRNANDN